MVAPSAPRDARSKIPPGPEGSNGIDRRGRRGQPAGSPPFWALESSAADEAAAFVCARCSPGKRSAPGALGRAGLLPDDRLVADHELAFYWLRVNRHASRVRCAYPGYVASEGSDVADRGWLRPSPHPNPRSAPRPSRCRECAPRVANRWFASAPSRPAGGRGARISLLFELLTGHAAPRLLQPRKPCLAPQPSNGSARGAVDSANTTHSPGIATRWPRARKASPSAALA